MKLLPPFLEENKAKYSGSISLLQNMNVLSEQESQIT
jgi:hypothetical protein